MGQDARAPKEGPRHTALQAPAAPRRRGARDRRSQARLPPPEALPPRATRPRRGGLGLRCEGLPREPGPAPRRPLEGLLNPRGGPQGEARPPHRGVPQARRPRAAPRGLPGPTRGPRGPGPPPRGEEAGGGVPQAPQRLRPLRRGAQEGLDSQVLRWPHTQEPRSPCRRCPRHGWGRLEAPDSSALQAPSRGRRWGLGGQDPRRPRLG